MEIYRSEFSQQSNRVVAWGPETEILSTSQAADDEFLGG